MSIRIGIGIGIGLTYLSLDVRVGPAFFAFGVGIPAKDSVAPLGFVPLTGELLGFYIRGPRPIPYLTAYASRG